MSLIDHATAVAATTATAVTGAFVAADTPINAETIGMGVILFMVVDRLFGLVKHFADKKEAKAADAVTTAAAAAAAAEPAVPGSQLPPAERMPGNYFERFVQSSESNGQRIEAQTRAFSALGDRLDQRLESLQRDFRLLVDRIDQTHCPLNTTEGIESLREISKPVIQVVASTPAPAPLSAKT